MHPLLDRTRLSTLLIASAIATYVLIALGTAVSTTGSAGSCTTWPSCSSDAAIGPVTADGALFVAHRAAALLAGALLAAATYVAWRREAGRTVRRALALAVGFYPVQIALGGALVVWGSPIAGIAHLALAMIIFGGVLVALAATLEASADARADASLAAEPDPEALDPGPEPSPDGGEPESVATAEKTPVTADAVGGTGSSAFADLRRTGGAYLALTKPKLMWLLCLVAVAGMGLATLTGESIEVGAAVATLVGGCLAIGASGTFNHVYERDRDRKMQRTADRPLVHDVVPVRNAVIFGAALTVASGAITLVWVNALASVLTLAAIAYYVVLYTILLKPNTAWNTVLGGGAGAIPALIGWAAVTGEVGLPAIVLAAVIFLWTPAHFYSLAIAYRDDYARGGFPMFPVVEGELLARRHILLFLGATLCSVSLLGWLAGLGWLYALSSVALGAVFLRSVVRGYRDPGTETDLRAFYVSNYYLGVVLVAIVLETVVLAG